MGRYVIRRLLQFIPTVFGALFLLHYLTSVAIQLTGNPVRALFGDRMPPESVLRNLTDRLGLGDPCLEQPFSPCLGLFVDRLESIFLHFDFGTNFSERPVTEIVAGAMPYTLRLTAIAISFELVVGISAGVLAGLRNGGFWDYWLKVSTVLIISVPVVVLGVVVRDFVNIVFGNWLRGLEAVPDVISYAVFCLKKKKARRPSTPMTATATSSGYGMPITRRTARAAPRPSSSLTTCWTTSPPPFNHGTGQAVATPLRPTPTMFKTT